MAEYRIIKTVDFGPWTIGDKNYGPSCPSCQVPVNNYAPKVGEIVQGILETKSYYVFENNKKVMKTGRGIAWPIATNGTASTQAQTSVQFITEDHLQPYVKPADPATNESSTSGQDNFSDSENEANAEKSDCWICEHKLLIIAAVLIILILLIQE